MQFLNPLSILEERISWQSKLYSKLCGDKVIDLLFHIPYNYIDRRKNITQGKVGDIVTFIATVVNHVIPVNKKSPCRVMVKTDVGIVTLVFFNYSLKYLKNVLALHSSVIISGKLEQFNNVLQITHPDYIIRDLSRFTEIAKIEPVYLLTKGLSNARITKLINSTLALLSELPEWIDEKLLHKKKWSSWLVSLKKLHNLDNVENLSLYRSRLVYDELLSYQIALRLMRNDDFKHKGRSINIYNRYYNDIIQNLGFELTKSQIQAINEIFQDQALTKRMVRLLQGDVGSGKTVVALLAMVNVIENSRQVAFMAPTEILAEQHYRWFCRVLEKYEIKIRLLLGKTKLKEKKVIREELSSGICQLIIGTHALFQEEVKFHDLGLVVIDEQQKFGVVQRMKLIEKGEGTDVLLMTATPIPRTLEQIMYADIDCSKLIEKPKCRVPIITKLMSMDKLAEITKHLQQAIVNGEKAYWICPYIEDSEYNDVAAAIKRYEYLKKFFPTGVGIMHGRLSQVEKDEVMLSFYNSEIKLLVATTVIEVGIDVPDATIMIIENAEQFGLSQLHQIRGRIGRSDKPSYCVMLYGSMSKIAYKKLSTIRDSQDGFYIAEQDLLLRGSGNILGSMQSGFIDFKFANIYKDQELLNLAVMKAKEIVKTDPALIQPQHANVKLLLKIFGYKDKLLKL